METNNTHSRIVHHEKNAGHKRRRRSHAAHRQSTAHDRRQMQHDLRDHAALIGRDMREMASMATERMREQLNPIQDYVQEKPLQSLMIAAGVGALLGLIFLRR